MGDVGCLGILNRQKQKAKTMEMNRCRYTRDVFRILNGKSTDTSKAVQFQLVFFFYVKWNIWM